MLRATLCAVAVFAAGSFARADELDKEAPGPKPVAKSVAPAIPGSELDKESPNAAYHSHGGWGHYGGYHGGWGYHGGYHGGWGYRGGYGYGGWGYRPYYAGYYRPYYRSYYYGPSIAIGYAGFGFGYNPWYW